MVLARASICAGGSATWCSSASGEIRRRLLPRSPGCSCAGALAPTTLRWIELRARGAHRQAHGARRVDHAAVIRDEFVQVATECLCRGDVKRVEAPEDSGIELGSGIEEGVVYTKQTDPFEQQTGAPCGGFALKAHGAYDFDARQGARDALGAAAKELAKRGGLGFGDHQLHQRRCVEVGRHVSALPRALAQEPRQVAEHLGSASMAARDRAGPPQVRSAWLRGGGDRAHSCAGAAPRARPVFPARRFRWSRPPPRAEGTHSRSAVSVALRRPPCATSSTAPSERQLCPLEGSPAADSPGSRAAIPPLACAPTSPPQSCGAGSPRR